MIATMTQHETLTLNRIFDAPRERVFDLWTTKAGLDAWFRPNPQLRTVTEVDLRVGGNYRVEMHPSQAEPYIVLGQYEVVEPPHKVAFTWRWDNEGIDPHQSLVTVEFFALGETQTEIVLTHSRLTSEEDHSNHKMGWVGCFDRLGELLTTTA